MSVELASPGRVWTRTFIARQERLSDPRYQLLQVACDASLNPGHNLSSLSTTLAEYPQEGEPLWPALARHLARCSTDEDRALLIDLAQHPEKREGPLSSGLQYYVRGDLLFENGSEMTLDALCDELGLPRLPYLEEMPPEIDLG